MGQGEEMLINQEREMWLNMANLLGISEGTIQYRLRRLQSYIARTKPEVRCPCHRGVALSHCSQHWPGCEEGNAQFAREAETEKEKREVFRRQVDIARQRSEATQLASELQRGWSPLVADGLSQQTLERIIEDCQQALSIK